MKTIYTTLPIYDRIEKQWFERAKRGGVDKPVPITCPRHRLPSFQWWDDGDGAAVVTSIEMIERDLTSVDITTYFPVLPAPPMAGDVYFDYSGDTLNWLLDEGIYYLKITMDTGHIYYSDWFHVYCVYENLDVDLNEHGDTYDTFTMVGTEITSAINLAGAAYTYGTYFDVIIGEEIKLVTYLTLTSGQLPYIRLQYGGVAKSNQVQLSAGLNDITLTATGTGTVFVRIYNSDASNFSASEVIVIRSYSPEYLTLNFSNTCDLGNIIYHGGFDQTLWFKSEPMEMTFPTEEDDVQNGEARFVRTFARQERKYNIKTFEMPGFMVDVFSRMQLHDTVQLIDLVGDTNDVFNLEVEHEWLWDDKYYARMELTFDYDETVVIGGCCN